MKYNIAIKIGCDTLNIPVKDCITLDNISRILTRATLATYGSAELKPPEIIIQPNLGEPLELDALDDGESVF